jgi:hypothetical protein
VTGAKAGDGATFDEQLGYVGRVAFIPFKGYDWLTHVGVNASRIAQPAQIAAPAPIRSPSKTVPNCAPTARAWSAPAPSTRRAPATTASNWPPRRRTS